MVWHLVGGRPVRLARANLQLRDGVPARPDHSGHLAHRRHAGPSRRRRAEADRLAYPWRRVAVRRRGSRHRARGRALRAGIGLCHLAHRDRADARPHRRRRRRGASQAHLLRRGGDLPLSRQPRGRRGLSLVHHRRARLRREFLRHAGADRRGAEPRRRVAVLRYHHPQTHRPSAAMADHRRHGAVAAEYRPGAAGRSMDGSQLSASAPAPSPSSTPPRPRPSPSSR